MGLLATACSSSNSPAPSPPTSDHSDSVETTSSVVATAQQGWPSDYAEYLASNAELYGIEDPPEVTPVRTITPGEHDRVIQACLAEQGFDVDIAPGGGYDILVPND